MFHLNNHRLRHLIFGKKQGKALVCFGPQVQLTLGLQTFIQIDSRRPKSPKLHPLGLQTRSQVISKSITYPTHIDLKTNSGFGLILTLICHQMLITFETKMASTCNKSYTTSKHSNHTNTHTHTNHGF